MRKSKVRSQKLQVLLLVVLAASVVIRASAQQPRPNQPLSVAEIAVAYPSYQKMTESPVHVTPSLALQCAPTRREQVETAQLKDGPHANATILVFMNTAAATAFAARTVYPVGAVIVKHKTISGYAIPAPGEPAHSGVGGMVKRAPGFDPDHGDWEYFYFEDPAKIESGRITTCVQCHQGAKSTDYVFGTWKR